VLIYSLWPLSSGIRAIIQIAENSVPSCCAKKYIWMLFYDIQIWTVKLRIVVARRGNRLQTNHP